MLSKGTLEEVFSEWQLLKLILTVDLAGNSLHVPLSSTHPEERVPCDQLDTQKFWQELGQLADVLQALQSVPLAVKDFTQKIFHLGLPLYSLSWRQLTRHCKSVNLVQCCAAYQQLGHACIFTTVCSGH